MNEHQRSSSPAEDAKHDSAVSVAKEGKPKRKHHKSTPKPTKFKKNPDAPKRFRSAFIIFSQKKHREIHAKLQASGEEKSTINIAKLVSGEWRAMAPYEREQWEEMARKDKARYMEEKAKYEGPWKIPVNKRKRKDPTSPKKPVPAYFAFSNARRQQVKQDNLSANNAEISKILSKMWKEAPGDVRAAYLKEEERQRQKYAAGMQEWREKRALEAEQEKEELNSREETEREHKKIGKGAISQDGKPQLGATTISNNGAASHLLGLGRQANAGSLATTGHLLQPGLLSQARTPQQLELAVSALASGIDRNATDLAALLTMTGAGLGLSQNLMPQFPVATAPSLVSGVNSTASNTAAILAAATNSGRLDLLGRGGMARLGLQGAYGNLEGGNSAIGALLPQFLGSPAAGLPLSTYSGLLGNSTGGIGTLGGFGAGSIASLLSSRDQGQGNLFGKYMQPSSSLSTAMVQDPLRNQALLEALLQGNRNHFGQTPANAMQQSELSNSSQLSNDLLLQLLATRGAGLTGAEEAKKSG